MTGIAGTQFETGRRRDNVFRARRRIFLKRQGQRVNSAPTMKMQLLKHTSPTATRDSGSYEVNFPDRRPSVFFYWDDNPGPGARSPSR